MKRTLILLLLIFAVVFSLSACKENQSPSGDNGGDINGDTENPTDGDNSDGGNSDGGDSQDDSGPQLPFAPF